MRRREFMTLVGGTALARPDAIVAQQPDRMLKKLPRIGFLVGAASSNATPLRRIYSRVFEHGYVEGQR